MTEHEHRRRDAKRKAVRPHPKPPNAAPASINQAIRQELWYVDTMVAAPFRTVRRQLGMNQSTWAQGADEALWALEGMARLPIKLLQSAFGEAMPSGQLAHNASPPSPKGRSGPDKEEEQQGSE